MNERADRSAPGPIVLVGVALGLLLLAGSLLAALLANPAAWSGLAAVGGRWLLLAGLCLMVGASFVGSVVYPEPRRSLLGLSAAAWVAAAVGLILVLLALGGAPLSVPLWRVAVLRGVPLVVGGIAIAGECRTGGQRPSVRGTATIGIAAAAAMLAAVGTSHLSASDAGHPEHVEAFVHWLHVVAVGTWLGGLAALLLSLPGEPRDVVGAAVRRFSTSAGIGIALVAVTGVLRGLQELGPLENLLTTDFGLLLVAKSALFVILAGLGAAQRLVGVPAASRRPGPLRRIGSAELAIGAVVLLLAAALVNVPAPG
jgi:putative copper export protein